MVDAYKKFWKNYANFKGRSTRADYWWVILANFLVSFAIGFVLGFIGASESLLSICSGGYALAVIIPGIAITVRRLHDVNKSGWFYFISLIPLVGGIILLVFLCTGSVNENNRYGERV